MIILGKQGAGKGTQCVRISHHYVVPHIATGDIFRAAAKSDTDAGRQARQYMEAGELVPDEVVVGVVAERLDQDDIRARGFVLDGFPRNTAQAESLAKILAPDDVDLVLNLEVPTEMVLHRLAARRVCTDCGANYSVDAPPKMNWICDVCGGEVVQRPDDTEAAIVRRLELYEVQTAPLIAWYMERDKLATVDGVGHPDQVTQRLVGAIDHRRDRDAGRHQEEVRE
ncbi:MAG: adenylate kinase [Acidimicrobiales bacterium]